MRPFKVHSVAETPEVASSEALILVVALAQGEIGQQFDNLHDFGDRELCSLESGLILIWNWVRVRELLTTWETTNERSSRRTVKHASSKCGILI